MELNGTQDTRGTQDTLSSHGNHGTQDTYDAKYDTFETTMEWPIVLISWIKFNQVTTTSYKAAYDNQKEWLISKSSSLEVVNPISQSELVVLIISFLITMCGIQGTQDTCGTHGAYGTTDTYCTHGTHSQGPRKMSAIQNF